MHDSAFFTSVCTAGGYATDGIRAPDSSAPLPDNPARPPVPAALHTIIATTMMLAGAYWGALLLLDVTGRRMLVRASCGEGIAVSEGMFDIDAILLDQFLISIGHDVGPVSKELGACLKRRLSITCERDGWLVAAPVRDGGQLVGMILLAYDRGLTPDLARESYHRRAIEQGAAVVRSVRLRADVHSGSNGLCVPIATSGVMRRASHLEETIGLLVEHARLMTAAETGAWLRGDPETEDLVVQRSLPVLNGAEKGTRLLPFEQDVAGEAFKSGLARVSNEASQTASLGRVFAGVRSCIAAPVAVAGRPIGVLLVSGKCDGDFTAEDMRVVGMSARYLGVLLDDTAAAEDHVVDRTGFRLLGPVAGAQQDGLRRTLAIHEEFTRMLLDGQGIEAICANIGRLTGNHVLVEDRFANPISSFAAGFDEVDQAWRSAVGKGGSAQGMREHPEIRGAMASLRQGGRPVRLPPHPRLGLEQGRVVAPVVVNREIMAYVWILESNRRLDEVDLMAVEQGAIAIALHIMREKAAADAQFKLQGDLVAKLLAGSAATDDTVLRQAAYLGIDLQLPRGVLVVCIDELPAVSAEANSHEAVIALKRELLDVVERTCRVVPWPVVAARGDEIVILAGVAAVSSSARAAELRGIADRVRAEVRRYLPAFTVSVGIGGCCDGLAQYAVSYHRACRALDMARASRLRDQTIAAQQAGIYALLLDPHNRDAVLAMVDENIGPLLAYDQRHAMQLTETLEQFLLHNCQLEPAAEAMHVHIGTLRYRLHRIEEILGTKLRSFEAKFNLQLALTALRAVRHQ